jgi:protein-S-isoprenylcysteine O-methyltransferase Ste14
MDAELPFRIVTVLVFLPAALIAFYFRLRARRADERLDRRQEGLLLAVSLRLAGLSLLAMTLAYVCRPASMHWSQVNLPDWLRWSGIVPGLIGAVLMYLTLSSLGRNLTDTVSTRRDATLVTRGPYRWVRHPFYVTAALSMLAVAWLTANVGIAVAGMLVITLLVIRTPIEEQKLIERFGDEYRRYMAVTGRFFPKLGS